MKTPGENPRATRRLPPTSQAPAQARQFLEEFASAHDSAADDCLEDGRLAISELVGNAVLHAGTPMTVHLAIAGDGLEMSVADSGPGTPRIPAAHRTAMGGRGLALVDRLSQCWGVLSRQGGKVVWCFLRPTRRTADGHQADQRR